MDGLEATRRIRALEGGGEVKIVALSASVFKEDRDQVLAAGADDFVAKPVQFGRIFDCMGRQLGPRFVFEKPPAEVAIEPAEVLDGDAVAALPPDLRDELAEGMVSLDGARIAGLIRRVGELNPALGGVLGRHADRFEYTIILRALQSCGSGVLKDEITV